MAYRRLEKMIRMEADKKPLRHICLDAASHPDPISALESNLQKFGLSSRREVHFCRGFLDAILTEGAGNR